MRIAAGPGCLGPGYPANAAIGRAVALSFSFLLGSLPGGADLTIQGSPAEFAYCCAENLAASPWPGLHAEHVEGETTVTVLAEAGWAKADVADYLFDHARNPRGALAGRGISPLWPDSFADLDPVPIAHRPEDILVVVASAPGLASPVAIPWGSPAG